MNMKNIIRWSTRPTTYTMRAGKQAFLSRRNFLKFAALEMGGFSYLPAYKRLDKLVFPENSLLGRVTAGKVDLKSHPDIDRETVGELYEDVVIPWLREVAGRNPYRTNQRWVETPDGFIWSPYLQPVHNSPNTPVKAIPSSNGEVGMWVEVSQPFVDLSLDNPPARAPSLQHRQESGLPPRLYYSQVMWVDLVKTDDQGQVWYRVNERYGTYGDILWGPAEAFRPLTSDEIEPISPSVEDKRVRVNVANQTLSCLEGKSEVFFTRISSGALYNLNGERVDAWATPIGSFPIWRKLVSLHMSGGTTGGGWDLPGIGYTSLFVGSGVAIHSTFWHNNFGEPMSRGCVNARPEDAKWVFRWTQPIVPYNPGDTTILWPGGTKVEVIEE